MAFIVKCEECGLGTVEDNNSDRWWWAIFHGDDTGHSQFMLSTEPWAEYEQTTTN